MGCASSASVPRGRLGAFVTDHRSMSGRTWEAELQASGSPVVGEHGFVAGAWGDCITAACVFESRTQWAAMAAYRDDGPAGQVLDCLTRWGFEAFVPAAERTETATHAAIAEGRPLPVFGPGAVLAGPLPGAPAGAAGVPFAAQGVQGVVVQGRPVGAPGQPCTA